MDEVKIGTVATMIGDIVGSRHAGRRDQLHQTLTTALDSVNRGMDPPDPLRVTVGDEFQGAFGRVEDAARATLRIRLALLPRYDVRIGIGWGEVSWLDRSAGIQDGPGWWAAREAIDTAKHRARGGLTALRTWFGETATGDPSPGAERWNPLLLCRDAVVSDLDQRSVTILTGLLDGHSQQAIAEGLGVSPSAVSQRIRRDGLAMLAAADRLLGQP